ncbi:MAG: hypothetical protein AAF065_08545 [Verrucomicrobiota bacterium]
MIGIKDTLELTAPIHGGQRLADRVTITDKSRDGQVAEFQKANPGSISATYPKGKRAKSTDLIPLPGMLDTLRNYQTKTAA